MSADVSQIRSIHVYDFDNTRETRTYPAIGANSKSLISDFL